MRLWLILILSGFVAAGCQGGRPPFHPVKDDPTKNSYEIYVSDLPYSEAIGRFKTLLNEQKWLYWVTRSESCTELSARKRNQWLFACGGGGPWCDWCTAENPYHVYTKWVIVEPRIGGATIKITEPYAILFRRHHPNTEIFAKAGISATLEGKGLEPYK